MKPVTILIAGLIFAMPYDVLALDSTLISTDIIDRSNGNRYRVDGDIDTAALPAEIVPGGYDYIEHSVGGDGNLYYEHGVLAVDNIKNVPEMDRHYYWALAAVSDTIDYFNKEMCPIENQHLLKMGNFFKTNPSRSKNEILTACTDEPYPFPAALFQGRGPDGKFRNADNECTGKKITNSREDTCRIFLENLIEYNNQYQELYRNIYRYPGTYVRDAGTCGGVRVFKVLDVVAPGGNPNSVGQDSDARAIYVVPADNAAISDERSDGVRYKTLGEYIGNGRDTYQTLDYRTFINERSERPSNDKIKYVHAGDIQGIYNNSYIFLKDVTHDIYKLANNGRSLTYYINDAYLMRGGARLANKGALQNSTGGDIINDVANYSRRQHDRFTGAIITDDYPINAAQGVEYAVDMGMYDIKAAWTKEICTRGGLNFKMADQSDIDAHTNAVIFEGRIVTLENLGHMLTGMHQGIVNTQSGDETVEENVIGLQGGKESPYQNAMRYWARDNVASRKDTTTFKYTQTDTEEQAFDMARTHMAKSYQYDISKITCDGECSCEAGTDDFVSCYYKDGDNSAVIIYTFDDICGC